MALIAGMSFIKIDGKSYQSNGEFTIKSANVKREPMPMADGSIHYSETVVPAMISGNLTTVPGVNPVTLQNAKNITVQVQAKNGKVYILKNAFFSGDGEINPKEGTFAVEFQGQMKVI
jgi:monomeric isocitrate dehydrogenase